MIYSKKVSFLSFLLSFTSFLSFVSLPFSPLPSLPCFSHFFLSLFNYSFFYLPKNLTFICSLLPFIFPSNLFFFLSLPSIFSLLSYSFIFSVFPSFFSSLLHVVLPMLPYNLFSLFLCFFSSSCTSKLSVLYTSYASSLKKKIFFLKQIRFHIWNSPAEALAFYMFYFNVQLQLSGPWR